MDSSISSNAHSKHVTRLDADRATQHSEVFLFVQSACGSVAHRSNRRYFEMYGITSAALEMLRTHGAGADNAFLALNLKSILFNLNAKPPALSAAAKPAQPRQGDSKDTGR